MLAILSRFQMRCKILTVMYKLLGQFFGLCDV
jgi:hypothetical protein